MYRPFFFLSSLLSLTAAIATPLLSPGVGTQIENRNLNQIYQAAQLEGCKVRVCWGGDIAISGDRITNAFKTNFPQCQLQVVVDVSKYLDSRIDEEDVCDVAVLQTVHDYARWKSEDRLLHYKVQPWNDLHPEFVDPDGAYTGYAIFTFGDTLYNPNKYVNTSVPTHYLDFLDPKYSGKLILTYPNDDDSILYLFNVINEKYPDFIDQLLEQKVEWVRGTATPAVYMMADNSTNLARSISFAASGVYVSTVATKRTEDIYMAWPQTAAIFKATKSPESAKLFMSYIMGDEWQARVTGGRFAVRKTFDKQQILKQKDVNPLGYVKFMSDRARVERWRFQIESRIGTPQGPSPLQISLKP